MSVANVCKRRDDTVTAPHPLGICVWGSSTEHNNLPADKVVRIKQNGDIIGAVHQSCDQRFSMSVQAKHGLCSELTELPGKRLIHLVNYRTDGPIKDISIKLRLPDDQRIKTITLISPERENERDLDFQKQAGAIIFRVPQVRTYEIAVVTRE